MYSSSWCVNASANKWSLHAITGGGVDEMRVKTTLIWYAQQPLTYTVVMLEQRLGGNQWSSAAICFLMLIHLCFLADFVLTQDLCRANNAMNPCNRLLQCFYDDTAAFHSEGQLGRCADFAQEHHGGKKLLLDVRDSWSVWGERWRTSWVNKL